MVLVFIVGKDKIRIYGVCVNYLDNWSVFLCWVIN